MDFFPTVRLFAVINAKEEAVYEVATPVLLLVSARAEHLIVSTAEKFVYPSADTDFYAVCTGYHSALHFCERTYTYKFRDRSDQH